MRKYNFIYDRLVEHENDLVGLIAYGLYKKKKIDWIKKFTEDKDSDSGPDESDLTHFHTASLQHLKEYRLHARALIKDFTDELMQENISEIEAEYDQKANELEEKFARDLKDEVRAIKTPFWVGIVQSMIASVAIFLVLGAMILVLVGWQSGILDTFKKISEITNSFPTEQISEPPPQK